MEFAQPNWLFLLILVPLYGVWHWWHRGRTVGLAFSNIAAASSMPRTVRHYAASLPVLLRMGALVLAILALARPQVRNVTQEYFAEGVDIVLVLDTSTSMQARDFQPNRFEAAREVAADFIDGRQSDRIGLIVFAAKAYTQAPLTLDYVFLKKMLAEVNVGVIEDGTAIGTALATAVNRLKDTEAESKVIILLTDGQNNRGEVDPVTASEVASALGVRIYSIGVGTYGEAPFIVDHPFAGPQQQMVPVEIDEDMLRSVSGGTGGQYFRATDKEALRNIYDQIGELEQTRIETRIYTDYDERYRRYLWPTILLVLLEILLSSTLLRRFP
ncbi:MAG: VWA domain-containing protein [Bacteroidota bacterium]|nr:VWA domain-containing protein [Bacteroidota bacterium]